MSLLSEALAALKGQRAAASVARSAVRSGASLPPGYSPPNYAATGAHWDGTGQGGYTTISGTDTLTLASSPTPYVFAVDHRADAVFQDVAVFAPVFTLPSAVLWTPSQGSYTEATPGTPWSDSGVVYDAYSGAVVVGGVTLTRGEGFAVQITNNTGSSKTFDIAWERSGYLA